MIAEPLDQNARRLHKLRNRAQSVLLLAAMLSLLSACGWVLAGGDGVLLALLAGGVSLLLSPRMSPDLALRLYGARPIQPAELPVVFELLARIAARAQLPRPPRLHYIPSRMLNAFAVGQRDDAAIALTDGLLRSLTLSELAGVLAHEVSHIRNGDLWIMGLADTLARLTSAMSFLGLLLLLANLPMLLLGAAAVPWEFILLLLFAPSAVGLLQLALSRTREYDADLDAAGLTGDPRGLASALSKLERFQAGLLETLFLPGRHLPEPSLLRTHPDTQARIARLLSLEPRRDAITREAGRMSMPVYFIPRPHRPRWHATGLWH
ncbi:MAG TPA: zinc metalloprotease HtpX [Acetobacteraceae bacterium]|nr:zinc metalloprotease HtpX [Acetobacteraceae bacterium]